MLAATTPEHVNSISNSQPITRLSHRLAHLYATFLVAHPFVNAILIAIFLIFSVAVALYFSDIPFFGDPTKDFITIGTLKSSRLYQLRALQQNSLSVPTSKFSHESSKSRFLRSVSLEKANIATGDELRFCFELPDQNSDELWSRFTSLSKIVVSLIDDESANRTFLTIPGAVKSLCQLQTRIESLPGYLRLCSKASLNELNFACCPIWSLANFIASIVGKTSCQEITEEDVERVANLCEICKEAFLTGALKRVCWDQTVPSRWLCPDVPPICFTHRHLLMLLAISGSPPHRSHWNSTLLVLPIWRQVGLQLWEQASLDRRQTLADLTNNLTVPLAIEAIELGSYGDLAGRYVLWDTAWLALGAASLALLLLLMTRGNLVVVGATFVSLGWSLSIAYGIYASLLLRERAPAFPLLNMMALVLLLGLGADDILLFYQVWISMHLEQIDNDVDPPGGTEAEEEVGKRKHVDRKVQRMALTLRHAVPSVCLTSLATMGGLLSSLLSSIVVVKRFAIYASLTVLCHVIYVLVVMPTLLHIAVGPHRQCRLSRLPHIPFARICTVTRLRFIFPPILICSTVVSAYLLFHSGWLAFPGGSLQPAFYRSVHPAEVYRLRGGEFSWAEHILRRHRGFISLHAVWGVHPHDPRNPWTWAPQDDEELPSQPLRRADFNIATPESLAWLSQFCAEVTKMPHILVTPSIPVRKNYLEEDVLILYASQNYGCAFGRSVLSFQDFAETHPKCTEDLVSCLTAFAKMSTSPTGLRFSTESGSIVGLVISITVNISLTNTSFSELQKFSRSVESWFEALQATAPPGLAGGFLVSPELTAFEAYEDVLKFLPLSLSLSVILAALIVFLSTFNVYLSVTTLLSVVATLLLSTLLLVLLGGWSLGIVEALILTLSAGLAVDPCIHLAFAIIQAKEAVWQERCRRALETVGWAVTGAAMSTALAGCAVLPSELQCYRQMGLFLLILMTSALLLCGLLFTGTVAALPTTCSFHLLWHREQQPDRQTSVLTES